MDVHFEGHTTKSLTSLRDKITLATELMQRFTDLAGAVGSFGEAAEQIENELTHPAAKEAIVTMKALTGAAKGGKINVIHNLKDINLNMEVAVHLDARQVGRTVANTKLGSGKNSAKFVAATADGKRAGFPT